MPLDWSSLTPAQSLQIIAVHWGPRQKSCSVIIWASLPMINLSVSYWMFLWNSRQYLRVETQFLTNCLFRLPTPSNRKHWPPASYIRLCLHFTDCLWAFPSPPKHTLTILLSSSYYQLLIPDLSFPMNLVLLKYLLARPLWSLWVPDLL